MDQSFEPPTVFKARGPVLPLWLVDLRLVPVTLLLSGIALMAFNVPQLFSSLDGGLWTSAGDVNVPAILGGHLLHWNGQHLFWDLGMFLLLGVLCESAMRWRYYALLVLSAIVIPVAVMWFNPAITTYRGLSGIDTSLFALLVLTRAIELVVGRQRECLVFLMIWLLMCGKILMEFQTGEVWFVQDVSFVPVPSAHLVGAVVGSLFALPAGIRRRQLEQAQCNESTPPTTLGFARWQQGY